jgi:hypothetical protein
MTKEQFYEKQLNQLKGWMMNTLESMERDLEVTPRSLPENMQ